MIPDYDEKRNFPRMRLNCEATVTDPESGDTFQTMVINLSGGGALFNADQSWKVGACLLLRVEAAGGSRPPFEAEIKVIRAEPRDNGGYQIAASIEQVKGSS